MVILKSSNFKYITSKKILLRIIIDSDLKQYEEIKKLKTGQSEYYTTGRLLDYEYLKNHYRLIAVDINRQQELQAHLKAIPQAEFVGQLKNDDDANADGPQSIFNLPIWEKKQINKTKIFSGKHSNFIKDGKLWRTQS